MNMSLVPNVTVNKDCLGNRTFLTKFLGGFSIPKDNPINEEHITYLKNLRFLSA